mmetsp:Transcript_25344/g.61039  ORF Transcript_25344/g.61039 Transcript_25344/m.61039 type:complete len:154 (+) Transcript_25344:35-496(+)
MEYNVISLLKPTMNARDCEPNSDCCSWLIQASTLRPVQSRRKKVERDHYLLYHGRFVQAHPSLSVSYLHGEVCSSPCPTNNNLLELKQCGTGSLSIAMAVPSFTPSQMKYWLNPPWFLNHLDIIVLYCGSTTFTPSNRMFSMELSEPLMMPAG